MGRCWLGPPESPGSFQNSEEQGGEAAETPSQPSTERGLTGTREALLDITQCLLLKQASLGHCCCCCCC